MLYYVVINRLQWNTITIHRIPTITSKNDVMRTMRCNKFWLEINSSPRGKNVKQRVFYIRRKFSILFKSSILYHTKVRRTLSRHWATSLRHSILPIIFYISPGNEPIGNVTKIISKTIYPSNVIEKWLKNVRTVPNFTKTIEQGDGILLFMLQNKLNDYDSNILAHKFWILVAFLSSSHFSTVYSSAKNFWYISNVTNAATE